MFLRPRRPLLGAAMLGGTFMAGRAAQRSAYREEEQDERLAGLENQPAAPAPAPAAPSGGASVVDQLKELSSLKDSGALSADEFEAAKQKLLGT